MSDTYDVIIVGSGIAGSILAKELCGQGLRVLVLEAGPDSRGGGQSPVKLDPGRKASGSQTAYLENFYLDTVKTPNAPYPSSLPPAKDTTPRARISDMFPANVNEGFPRTGDYLFDPKVSYMLQKGPLPFTSTYERIGGGTMMHWMGTCLRNLPKDFRMKSAYFDGDEPEGENWADWPLSYDDLIDDYGRAEHEIGVSGDAREQQAVLGELGLRYPSDYQYPMQPIPASLVDAAVASGIDRQAFLGGTMKVLSTPAGRNGKPWPDGPGQNGRRLCQGNTNCTPICPIQAKYDPTFTLRAAQKMLDADNNALLRVRYQTVASKVLVDAEGRVSGVEAIRWRTTPSGRERIGENAVAVYEAKLYVIAGHAIETPKLLLNSTETVPEGVANSSGEVGNNLMDHPVYISWAYTPEDNPIYPFRGPISTSGIGTLRDGDFRSAHASWRIEIGNEGWNWPTGDPYTLVSDLVEGTNEGGLNPNNTRYIGKDLARALNKLLTRQFRLGFLVEQSPQSSNTIRPSRSPNEVDALGIPRPIITYDLSPYTRRGFIYAEIASRLIFAGMNAHMATTNKSAGQFNWFRDVGGRPVGQEAEDILARQPQAIQDAVRRFGDMPKVYNYQGAGHIVGTYRMGSAKSNSVVDSNQRSWDHDNLYLVGSGTFPTVATANPTLTLAALCYRTARAIVAQVRDMD